MWTKRNDDVCDNDVAVLVEVKPTLSMILILDDHDDVDALYSNYDDVVAVFSQGTYNMMANKNDDVSVILEAVEFVLVVVI